MRYLLLIYTEEQLEASPETMGAEFAAYDAFTKEVRDRGIYEAGEALRPTSTATTVRVQNGQTMRSTVPMNFPLRPGDTISIAERWF